MSKVFAFLAAAVLMVVNAGQTEAAFIGHFNNTGATVVPGSGIGDELPGIGAGKEAGAGGGLLLGVDHTAPTSAGAFNLAVGQSKVFNVTNIQFNVNETNIIAGELDNVGFTVGLTLTDPDGNVQNIALSMTGTAFLNTVSGDAAVDYSLVGSTQVFTFGGPQYVPAQKGHYTVTVAGATLANNAEIKALTVTVTLTAAPVPEPTSMALLGLGAIGAAVSSYRRKRVA